MNTIDITDARQVANALRDHRSQCLCADAEKPCDWCATELAAAEMLERVIQDAVF